MEHGEKREKNGLTSKFRQGAFFPTLLAIPIQLLESQPFIKLDAFGRISQLPQPDFELRMTS
jgi:hypothetical protein